MLFSFFFVNQVYFHFKPKLLNVICHANSVASLPENYQNNDVNIRNLKSVEEISLLK